MVYNLIDAFYNDVIISTVLLCLESRFVKVEVLSDTRNITRPQPVARGKVQVLLVGGHHTDFIGLQRQFFTGAEVH